MLNLFCSSLCKTLLMMLCNLGKPCLISFASFTPSVSLSIATNSNTSVKILMGPDPIQAVTLMLGVNKPLCNCCKRLLFQINEINTNYPSLLARPNIVIFILSSFSSYFHFKPYSTFNTIVTLNDFLVRRLFEAGKQHSSLKKYLSYFLARKEFLRTI